MSAVANPESGLDADERIAIVSESTNEVTGSARRAEMRRDNLPHRATYVFIQAPGGESEMNPDLWVQKRTMIKDYCPGLLDPSTGGVVGHGESYEDNARRELEEEMGVKATGVKGEGGGRAEGELRHCFSFHYKDNHTNVWGDAWDCVWGGEIVPQPEEVQSVHRYSLSELIAGQDKAGEKLESTPDGVIALEKYRDWLAEKKEK
ncbi:unnamed protein product [Ectocarpus sp. CCAP 1310/34]|nr:unnamed protein product [Ectocarpus sp. CCAP 1310/34]